MLTVAQVLVLRLVIGLPWVLSVYLVSNDKPCGITFRLNMSISSVAASHHPLTQSRKPGVVGGDVDLKPLSPAHSLLSSACLVLSNGSWPWALGHPLPIGRERLTRVGPSSCSYKV